MCHTGDIGRLKSPRGAAITPLSPLENRTIVRAGHCENPKECRP
jgi:hypothetical protein